MSFKTVLCTLGLFAAVAYSQSALAQAAPADDAPGKRGAADTAAPAGDDAPGKRGAADPVAEDAAKPEAAASATVDALGRAALAAQLAAIGRETKSPYALAAAGELLATVGTGGTEPAKEKTEGGEAPAAGAQPTEEPVTDAKALFDEAVALANAASNAPLAAQIEQTAAAAGSRAPVANYARHRDRVNPYATDVYRVRYRGGERARATVQADYRYDIDLYIYNSSGNLVAYDNDSTSIGICTWNPSRTRDYYLNLKNTTSSYVSYVISTN
jgi:hypothetical protein